MHRSFKPTIFIQMNKRRSSCIKTSGVQWPPISRYSIANQGI